MASLSAAGVHQGIMGLEEVFMGRVGGSSAKPADGRYMDSCRGAMFY